ncbi:MAG: SDR family oxidoreductase [bacterium]
MKGKVAFITGAGSGIGKATAFLFAQQGLNVSLLSRSEEELDEVVTEIRSNGGESFCVTGDISEPDEVRQAIEQTVNRWGRLDVVFANAGINGVWAPLDELEVDEWDKTVSINIRGTFLTVKYAIPHMKQNGGSVIITSSINGTRVFSNSGATAYSCTKAAQVAFTKMTAVELGKYRIRVNAICPGLIETEIMENTTMRNIEKARVPVEYPEGDIPLTRGKGGTSQQVAQLAWFLASDASSHITGTEVYIDGAQSLLRG